MIDLLWLAGRTAPRPLALGTARPPLPRVPLPARGGPLPLSLLRAFFRARRRRNR